jgi:hypothetical protein
LTTSSSDSVEVALLGGGGIEAVELDPDIGGSATELFTVHLRTAASMAAWRLCGNPSGGSILTRIEPTRLGVSSLIGNPF